MKPSEVISTVNSLEVSPSKGAASGGHTHPDKSVGGDAKTPGKKTGGLKKGKASD
jgi:hypothetical protein